ncbi:solute carrier family 5 member 4-like [Pteropus medius]|uniref:solute carrier family 5 member 4-like n=1 Tax=Pteropus vampyrus TaxID=132908 RepID=UPI00196A235D|nr:solute carrier family 5 member 4-like [Pteropus giganteus]
MSEFTYDTGDRLPASDCPDFICGVHYLLVRGHRCILVSIPAVPERSLVSKPFPVVHLSCLCWALLNSTKEQIDLDEEEKTRDETYGAVEAGRACSALITDSSCRNPSSEKVACVKHCEVVYSAT